MSGKTVFLSYRRDAAGKAFARLIEQALTHRGYDVFLDGIVMIDHLIVRSRHEKPWTKRDDMLDWEM